LPIWYLFGFSAEIGLAELKAVERLHQAIVEPDPALKGSLDVLLRFLTIRYVFSELDFILKSLKEYLSERSYCCSKLTVFSIPREINVKKAGKEKTRTLEKVVAGLAKSLEDEEPAKLKARLLTYCYYTFQYPKSCSAEDAKALKDMARYWEGIYKWMVESLFDWEEIVWESGLSGLMANLAI
jgi:hypothetical protein